MPGVSFAIADFITGGPIVDLPVAPGASWGSQINRPDALSCTVDMRDSDALKLDLRSATEPKKSVLLARTADVRRKVLAWGLVNDDRVWDEDAQTVKLSATGIDDAWLGKAIVGPVAALSTPFVVNGLPNPALDTTLSGWSLGTIGKKLLQQRLAWPGSPIVFELPADEVGVHTRTYPFIDFASVRKRLDDLTGVEGGPDFAFDAAYGPSGINLVYVFRHGSSAQPRLGSKVGTWSIGGMSPLSGLTYADNATDLASALWMLAGRNAGEMLGARVLNDTLVSMDGYPSLDLVDKTRSDVSVQTTLDGYAVEGAQYAATPYISTKFSVRGDATPGLGDYSPGDRVTIGVPADHPWIRSDFDIRITGMSGDETGESVKIQCEVGSWDA